MSRHGRPGPSVTRRGVLVAGVLVAATGAGAAAGLVRSVPRQAVSRGAPPPELAGALAREQQLVAGLDAALRFDPSLAARLGPIRADHAAHADALRSALASYPGGVGGVSSGSGSSAPPAGQAAPSLARLRASEADAARLAAGDSLDLGGARAALLASISAAEAGHVELLR